MEDSNIYPDFSAKRLGDYIVKTKYITKPDLSKSKQICAIGHYHIYTSLKSGLYYVINDITGFYGLGNVEKK